MRKWRYVKMKFTFQFECSNAENRYQPYHSSRFGSRILFRNRRESHISWVDPTTLPPEFQTLKTELPSLLNPVYGAYYLNWGEIDGKLYCIYDTRTDTDEPDKPCFEVLESNPENNVVKWRPLLPPPFYGYGIYLFLNRSKRILNWKHKERGVYIYDITAPEKGWTKAKQSSLRDVIPFLVRGHRILVIDDHPHSGFGNVNLVLNLDYEDDEDDDSCCAVYPFLLSENCDMFQTMNDPIYLPPELKIWECEFVNLGYQKFCIVVDILSAKKILVLTYEYDLIVGSNNVLEIQIRFLGTRSFRYPSSKDDCCPDFDYIGGYLL